VAPRIQARLTAMPPAPAEHRDRLLPWIAAERAFRAVVLIAVGIALVTHPHADWAGEITRFAQRLGLNPNDNWIRKLIDDVRRISASEDVVFGTIAIAFGALEGTEAYGLWRRRRWAEWLTVLATSLLLIPEIWALTKSITLFKAGGLVVNLLVVGYLISRLRRPRTGTQAAGPAAAAGAHAQPASGGEGAASEPLAG
jgi:uncharacterized membrane protein (DUF2068 family)